MLLSLSWLREFTPYEGTAQALGDRLTMLGLELEDIKQPFAMLGQITTGEVIDCTMHPDSDHLHCCKVDVGQEALLDIVCGAPNVAQGQKVAVATVGSSLPDGTLIKKSKLRGQPSHGMICSERELGLSEDHSGIMVLDPQIKVGQRLIDVLPLDTEILDLSITPNRADCLSVLGLARETAMIFNLPLSIPELSLAFGEQSTVVDIKINDPSLCWLYAGRLIHNIKLGASPLKIRQRLQACGIRAISNIVDVTNYILLEVGQPLHAFDFGQISTQQIVVRKAKDGEKFITLDGQERILESRDLCICNGDQPVALAGVMGGANSEITSSTRDVFLESAVFNPASIRKTSKRLGLSSESSYRFERGIDQNRTLWSLDRAAAMMTSLAGGEVDQHLNVNEPKPFKPAVIDFHVNHASSLLGVEIEDAFAQRVFQGLGCQLESSADHLTITQPSWRPDLTREADLIEEVARVYGLDNIKPELPPMQFKLDQLEYKELEFTFWHKLRNIARGMGLNEAINYSFVGQKDLDLLGLPKENRIAIKNPLSADQDVLRTVVAPGLLQNLRTNIAQGAQSVRLFELCHVFEYDESQETHAKELPTLGIMVYGLRNDNIWPYTAEDMNYNDLRGMIEQFLLSLHCPAPSFTAYDGHSYLLPCVQIKVGEVLLGYLGRVLPKIADEFLAQKSVWLAEIDLLALQKLSENSKVTFKPLAVFPFVKRDITVIGPSTLQVGMVFDQIRKLQHPLVEDVEFVSWYEPDGSQDKHLSFRLTFRHASRTLKDAEVDKERDKIAQHLIKTLGVRI